jgi:diguanylate cyclase (GGDEF)-like protein
MNRIFTGPSRGVLAVCTAFLGAVALSAGLLVAEERKAELNINAEQTARFVTGAVAALNRQLLGVDVMLANTDGLLKLSLQQPQWIDSQAASTLLRETLRQDLLVRSLVLLDAHGQVIASSSLEGNNASLDLPAEFVNYALSQAVSTMVVSPPTINFISSERVLYFARHIRLGDGSRVLAVAEIQIPQLMAVIVQGADIDGLQVTLERSNGELLGSEPASENMLGRRLSPALGELPGGEAVRRLPGRLLGVDSQLAARTLLYPDLWISASVPMDIVLVEWRRKVRWTVGVAIAFALLILVTAGLALWYFQRMHEAQLNLSSAKERLDQALESMDSGFLLLNAKLEVLEWNRRFLEIYPELQNSMKALVPFKLLMDEGAKVQLAGSTDMERKDWVDKRLALLSAPNSSHERTMHNGRIIQITDRATPDGGVVIVYQDITRMRQAALEIQHLAFYDALTNLPNRRLLTDRLQQAVATAARTGHPGALLFIDLDNFKTLNDTAGHDVGDQLLQQVGTRIRACVRDMDTVARLGGDEFVVMLQGLSKDPREADAQVQVVGNNLIAGISKPYFLDGAVHNSTCSVGATVFADNQQTPADLLKQADIAMYQVKSAGRNGLCFFNRHMLDTLTSRADLERDLRLAIENEEFELHYQLQVAEPLRAVGAEVLVRWRHPVKGLVSPLEFIAAAEDTGLIVPLGLWVLHAACHQLKRWETMPERAHLQLAVNVSARQFGQPDFVRTIHEVLQSTGANPQRLKLELTESLVIANVQDTVMKMEALKALGVRFAMDDFGTGQSSLTYLTTLPLDQLKIDQSFVRNIGVQARDAVIIDTIIGMATNLGLEVIAEGVETTTQRSFLLSHGCRLFQGYLFAKPVPIDVFEASLGRAEADKIERASEAH